MSLNLAVLYRLVIQKGVKLHRLVCRCAVLILFTAEMAKAITTANGEGKEEQKRKTANKVQTYAFIQRE